MGRKKNIYVMCKSCGKRINIKLDRDLEVTREDNLYYVVHAHGELGENAHALIVEIDRNLNVRNVKVSDDFVLTFDI